VEVKTMSHHVILMPLNEQSAIMDAPDLVYGSWEDSEAHREAKGHGSPGLRRQRRRVAARRARERSRVARAAIRQVPHEHLTGESVDEK
jgi:hypothetical protein